MQVDIDKAGCGFAAKNLSERKTFLFALRDVMLSWVGCKERCQDIKEYNETTIYSDTLLETFERKVVLTYVQYFFDSFGRAPVTPLRL